MIKDDSLKRLCRIYTLLWLTLSMNQMKGLDVQFARLFLTNRGKRLVDIDSANYVWNHF